RALSARASTLYADPCLIGAPWVTKQLQILYRKITTHTPWLWRRIYESTERQDFSRKRLPLMAKPEDKLRQIIADYKPDAIVSTYPLYPYFIERIFEQTTPKIPVITLVTDSIAINAAWRKAPTDFWMVTDQHTKQHLTAAGIAHDQIVDVGFPVDPHFADLKPINSEDPIDPLRILYFPTPKKPHVRRVSRELLEATGPNSKLTIVLGKHLRKIHSRAKEIEDQYPGRVTIKGWTKKVPELLNNHHVVVGKAGGATVHEALAAECPMLIHHLVPGQEEGNLALLRLLNGGDLADDEGILSQCLNSMLADNASSWRKMKRDLATHSRPRAADQAADFILQQISLH
ncbi:MAG: MGDG synthase family glycosyltransferase, partial [Akkermansiaceae bacterium]